MDMFSDESVEITQTIQNIKDISKVFTDFTKTFTLPASPTNNKLFKHYYNYNIFGGFDARTKKTSNIDLNFKTFRDGKVKLEGVDLKDGQVYSYRVTFFGSTINLKDVLAEDNLSSLDWLSNFNLDYDAAAVRGALETGTTIAVDGINYKIIAPLITHTERLYYNSVTSAAGSGNLYGEASVMQGVPYTELKYALPIKAIIKAIENSTYGITFSTDFFNENNKAYNDLYMWMHRKKGEVFDSTEFTHQVIGWTENLDEMEEVAMYPDRILVFNSVQGVNYNLVVNSNTADPYTVIIKKEGLVFRQFTDDNGFSSNISGILTNSSTGYTVFVQTKNAINIQVNWNITSINYPESFSYESPTQAISLTRSFIITQQLPEMKIIDFLTGLFKMFNLTVYAENGIINVKTLDSYYETDVTRDITKYIDVNTHTVDAALPFEKIKLEYEGLGTKLALNHQQTFNQGWGTDEYNGGGRFDAGGDTYEVTLPFEHLKYERLYDSDNTTLTVIQVGWFVDDNNDSYFGKPLLFYPIRIETNLGNSIRFLNDSTSSFTDLTDFFIPSNSVSLDYTISKENINFNAELNEYTNSGLFTDTLFKSYYETYITDAFKSGLRLSKFKAFFDLKFLLNYKLSDTLQILDRVYKINSITTNLQSGESSLELLNVIKTAVAVADICTADTDLLTAYNTIVTADKTCGTNTTTTTTSTTTTSTTTTTTTVPPTTTTTTTTCLANGTLISTYCDGNDLRGTYANGSCGTYDALIESNSASCVTTTTTTTTCAANGTLAYTYCDGTTLMGVYNDGSCGTYDSFIEANSASCPSPTYTQFTSNENPRNGFANSSLACGYINGLTIYSSPATTIDGIVIGTMFKIDTTQNSTWIGENLWYGISTYTGTAASPTIAVLINNSGEVTDKVVCPTSTTTTTTTTTLPPDNATTVERNSDGFAALVQLNASYSQGAQITISNDGSNCYTLGSNTYNSNAGTYPTITGVCATTTTTTAPPLCNSDALYVSTVSAEEAYCNQVSLRNVYHNGTTFDNATIVYGTSSNCSTPQSGNVWYSDGSSKTWYWNGSSKSLVANPTCP